MDQYKLDMQQTLSAVRFLKFCLESTIHVDLCDQCEMCLYEYGELEQG